MSTTLIVDRDPMSRQMLGRLASLQGHDVVCVGSLAEAVDQFSVSRPERILIELTLGDGNGTDLLRRVRQLELPVSVAVIKGMREHAPRELSSLAPDLVVQKPIDIVRLIQWLEEPVGFKTAAASR